MNSSLLIAKMLNIAMWLIIIAVVISIISTILSYFIIDVTEYTVTSKKIPKSFNGYKILQLSDLHDASYGKNNSKLLKKIREINPDIIVMTGDMISTNSKSFDNFYSLAKEVSKEYITYYIMGNHELRMPKTQQTKILENLKKFGIKILDNKSINIEKNDEYIKLYGFHQPVSTYKNILKGNFDTSFTLKNMEKIFPYIDNTNFNILLSHSPFDFDVLEKWGADLVLSGHVHGGLIRLPFLGGFLSPERSFFPKYDSGEYCIGDSKMIVSRGLGNGTINIRVFNNPEICVITLNSLEV